MRYIKHIALVYIFVSASNIRAMQQEDETKKKIWEEDKALFEKANSSLYVDIDACYGDPIQSGDTYSPTQVRCAGVWFDRPISLKGYIVNEEAMQKKRDAIVRQNETIILNSACKTAALAKQASESATNTLNFIDKLGGSMTETKRLTLKIATLQLTTALNAIENAINLNKQ